MAAAAAAVAVPEEIIMEEILPRLPIKSIVCCLCVRKSWSSQLYNPKFLCRLNRRIVSQKVDDDDNDYLIFLSVQHYNRGGTLPYDLAIISRKQLLITRPPFPISLTSFDNKPCALNLLGSINGLVCINFYFNKDHHFVLWNPMIRFSKTILFHKDFGFKKYDSVYGFSWDYVTNDYKLIIISTNPFSPFIAIYSSNKNCWGNKIRLDLLRRGDHFYAYPCVIVNGSPYWHHWTRSCSILKFDARNDEFTYLDVPIPYDHHYKVLNLNDCLVLVQCSPTSLYSMDVYRFDEERKVWMKMYTIEESLKLELQILYCYKYGGEIVFYRDKHLHLYDPNSCEIKLCRHYLCCGNCIVKSHKRKRCGPHDAGAEFLNGFSYTPSLVLLQGMEALHL